MSQRAAHLVDHVIPHVPVRQWVLPLPIPLRVLLAAQPEGGAVTLIQRFGSAANLNLHLHRLVLHGVYRCGADRVPTFVEAGTPSDDELRLLLQTVIIQLMYLLTRRGALVEDMGQTYLGEPDGDGEESRTLRPLQAVAITYRIAAGPCWRRCARCSRRIEQRRMQRRSVLCWAKTCWNIWSSQAELGADAASCGLAAR